jgi:hypothetical protein
VDFSLRNEEILQLVWVTQQAEPVEAFARGQRRIGFGKEFILLGE